MSKEVLNMEMSKDIFQTLDGVRISWPWKRGGGGPFYITRWGVYILIWFNTTSDMKADQNDRHEYVVLFLQTLIDLDYANEQDQTKLGG